MTRRPGRVRGLVPAVAAVAARPRSWPVAGRQLRRLAAPGWWRRPPFLPFPDRSYLGFRMETMYGDAGHPPEPDDLLAYLLWCAEADRHR